MDTSGASDTRHVADALAEILGGKDPFFSMVDHVDPHFAAVQVLKPFSYALDQPVREDDNWLFFDGALFNGGMEGRSEGTQAATSSLIRLLGEIRSRDLSGLRSLNGQFNAVAGFPGPKRMVVVTDRLGSRPLYYGSSGTKQIVASEIKAVVAALDRPFPLSQQGVLELFAFGHNVGDRTVLKGIRVLPPGSVIEIDERGIRSSPYFQYRYRAEPYLKDPAALGERITSAVREAVPAYFRARGRKGFFLSGGLDSRIIAGAVEEEFIPLNAFTFGYPESRDVVYAANLSKRLGFTHHVFTYPEIYLSKVIRDVVARTECAAPFYHATSLLFHERIHAEADAIVVGFCGDVFSGGHLRPAMFKLPPGPEITGLIFDRALCTRRQELARIFHPHVMEHVWMQMVDSFRSGVDKIEGQSGVDVADVWDVENRQRRFTFSAPKVDRRRFEVLAPLLDNRFVDLVLTLPAWARRGQLAYRHAIFNGYPALQGVPCAATGKPLQLNPLWGGVQEMMRLGNRAASMVLARFGLRTDSLGWRFRDIGEEMRRDRVLF
ncbi:MAG: asparagine synthase-related protein, partial [Planctomycetota bacterium]